MNRPAKAAGQAERELARRFEKLRVEERCDTPDFPAEAAMLQYRDARRGRHRRIYTASAIAASLAFIAVMLFEPSTGDDPVETYASIMDGTIITTDSLLLVSSSTFPEATGVPGIYEIDMPGFNAQVEK